jgi:hypothetical protein
MLNFTQLIIDRCIQSLQDAYCQTFKHDKLECIELITSCADIALKQIAKSDALYHDVEHTILVTLVGQEILRGKQILEGNVSAKDWLHSIVSLLFHDIGFIKGICSQDNIARQLYATGIGERHISLPDRATDASLNPYHVDRGKMFIREFCRDRQLLDSAIVQRNIELTRFPVPAGISHQDTKNYPGLTRAADLIGQLADPRYLQKLPALFYELQENGSNQTLGYKDPGDLRAAYPKFFRNFVYPYIQDGISYLEVTPEGQQVISNLYNNVWTVEKELKQADSQLFFSNTQESIHETKLLDILKSVA